MPSVYTFGPVSSVNKRVHVRCTPVISEQVRLILNPDTFIESTMMLETIETEVEKCFRRLLIRHQLTRVIISYPGHGQRGKSESVGMNIPLPTLAYRMPNS